MENNIDKLFKTKLKDDVTAYDPAAWGRMAALIDEDDRLNGPPIYRKKGWRKYLGLLALLLIISVVGFGVFNKTDSTESQMAMSGKDLGAKSIGDIRSLNQTSKTQPISQTQQTEKSERKDINRRENSIADDNAKNNEEGNISSDLNTQLKREVAQNEDNSINRSKTYISDSEVADITLGTSMDDIFKTRINREKRNTNTQPIYSDKNNNTIVNSPSDNVRNQEGSNSLDISETENLGLTKTNSENQISKPETVGNTGDRSMIDSKKSRASELLNSNASERLKVMDFPFLNTLTSELEADYKITTPAMTAATSEGGMTLGLLANMSYQNGYAIQVGPSIDYPINTTWSVTSGIHLDYIDYQNGETVTIQDKVYSFGSELVDRSLTLDKRSSINLPLNAKYKINDLSIFAGVSFNYHLATKGNIDDGEGNIQNVWVSDDSFNRLLVNYQAGASYIFNRNIELQVGLAYRNSPINNSLEVTSASTNFYPTVGINYLISKI